jgi:hypothetical protein
VTESVAEAWQRCRPWIEDALTYAPGLYTIEDVEAQIGRGEAWFWPAERAALVTEIAAYPRKKLAVLWLAGGELDNLLGMHPSVEAWARSEGCDAIIEQGRAGWGRAMSRFGYRPAYTAIWKELT